MKYVVINEENGVIDNFPLEDPKHISEVDPVNEITLKRNYTNLNIARTLKNKILNSVLKHTKRARKIMLEWQTNKEMEKNREKEIVNKIEEENENKIEEEKIENNTKNLKSLEIKNIPNFIESLTVRKFSIEKEIQNKNDDCPIIIDKKTAISNEDNQDLQKNIFLLFEEKEEAKIEKPKKFKKKIILKNNLKEDSKDEEMDNDFDEFVESVKMKLNGNGNIENEEMLNEINNSILPKKRKSVQTLEKKATKKAKSNAG